MELWGWPLGQTGLLVRARRVWVWSSREEREQARHEGGGWVAGLSRGVRRPWLGSHLQPQDKRVRWS